MLASGLRNWDEATLSTSGMRNKFEAATSASGMPTDFWGGYHTSSCYIHSVHCIGRGGPEHRDNMNQPLSHPCFVPSSYGRNTTGVGTCWVKSQYHQRRLG